MWILSYVLCTAMYTRGCSPIIAEISKAHVAFFTDRSIGTSLKMFLGNGGETTSLNYAYCQILFLFLFKFQKKVFNKIILTSTEDGNTFIPFVGTDA